ncbi:hypothetical protein V4C53_35520 [Paraburkholderia azotifigens]|uniref:hypothetical protein n=1 Tax=Paraburkholderia azotifigens TaxID=2057004 RepID=UPI00316B9A37
MTLDQLYIWHREQQERWSGLAENNKANLPTVYKASLKRTYHKKADFHADAVALLKSMRGTSTEQRVIETTRTHWSIK